MTNSQQLDNRINKCIDAIRKREFIQEANQKKIASIKETYLIVQSKLNDDARQLINSNFPEFNDSNYINSLDTMSYEEQQEFAEKLDNLIKYLLDYIEGILQ